MHLQPETREVWTKRLPTRGFINPSLPVICNQKSGRSGPNGYRPEDLLIPVFLFLALPLALASLSSFPPPPFSASRICVVLHSRGALCFLLLHSRALCLHVLNSAFASQSGVPIAHSSAHVPYRKPGSVAIVVPKRRAEGWRMASVLYCTGARV